MQHLILLFLAQPSSCLLMSMALSASPKVHTRFVAPTLFCFWDRAFHADSAWLKS